MAVQAPFTAGVDEAVKDEGLEDLIPARALAAGWKFFAPERIKTELLPEFAAKPAGTPLTRTLQTHVGEADPNAGNG